MPLSHGGGDEHVGAGIPDQGGGVGIEPGVGVGPGRYPEGTEYLLGESVDGGDGGGVELGHRPLQPGQLVGVTAFGQQGQQVRHRAERGGRPPGAPPAATTRSRTRDRSSLVAARVKVTISSSDADARPSARNRVARSVSV